MTLNNIPRNISYEFDKNNNLVLKPKDETKVSSYDISRHDKPVVEMKYADGTKVKINDREYTIAEAIWMKNHGIDAEEELLENMKMQYNDAKTTLLAMNGTGLEEKAEKYVIGLYGSKEGKTNTDDFDKAKKSFIEANTYDLIDPIKILDKMNALEEYIANFKAEVDAALSCSNAITEITVEY